VQLVDKQEIGVGKGFAGSIARLQITGADVPPTVVVKLPATWGLKRAFCDMAGYYERECRFYEELSTTVGMRVPRCYASQRGPGTDEAQTLRNAKRMKTRPGWLQRLALVKKVLGARLSRKRYALLLEDLGRLEVIEQADGCSLGRARQALDGLARMHARLWSSDQLDKHWLMDLAVLARVQQRRYVRAPPRFRKGYSALLGPNVEAHLQWLVDHGQQLAESLPGRAKTLVHGDYRLDNLFFDGDEVVATDWQICARGPGAIDVAFFLSCNLAEPASEREENELLDGYHDRLCEQGVVGYQRSDLLRDYHHMLLVNLWGMLPVASMGARVGAEGLYAPY